MIGFMLLGLINEKTETQSRNDLLAKPSGKY
jgi:hypothetical protein